MFRREKASSPHDWTRPPAGGTISARMARAASFSLPLLSPLVVVSLLGAAPGAPETTSPEAEFARGLAAEEKGDAKGARAAYEKSLTLKPDHGRALINLGILDIRERRVAEGLKLCERALGLDPGAAKAHYCLGVGLVKTGREEDAAASLERSIVLLGSEPAPKIELAHLRRKARRYEEAVRLYREAVRLQADDADLHVHLGYCYKELGDLKAAEVEYRKAVQKQPESFFGHLNLGYVLVRAANDAEAETHYLRAAELKPLEPDPHFNLGNLYRRRGDLVAARDRYQRATDLAPKRPEHHHELARVLWNLGDPETARKHLDLALALQPSDEMRRAIAKTMGLLSAPPPKRAVSDPKASPRAPMPVEEARTKGEKTPPM